MSIILTHFKTTLFKNFFGQENAFYTYICVHLITATMHKRHFEALACEPPPPSPLFVIVTKVHSQ